MSSSCRSRFRLGVMQLGDRITLAHYLGDSNSEKRFYGRSPTTYMPDPHPRLAETNWSTPPGIAGGGRPSRDPSVYPGSVPWACVQSGPNLVINLVEHLATVDRAHDIPCAPSKASMAGTVVTLPSATGGHRQAPHNIEAEQSLLGAVLVNNEAYYRVADFLKPEHFFEPLHRLIYELAADRIRANKVANPITLKGFLPSPLDVAGLSGQQYLARLAAEATTISRGNTPDGVRGRHCFRA